MKLLLKEEKKHLNFIQRPKLSKYMHFGAVSTIYRMSLHTFSLIYIVKKMKFCF